MSRCFFPTCNNYVTVRCRCIQNCLSCSSHICRHIESAGVHTIERVAREITIEEKNRVSASLTALIQSIQSYERTLIEKINLICENIQNYSIQLHSEFQRLTRRLREEIQRIQSVGLVSLSTQDYFENLLLDDTRFNQETLNWKPCTIFNYLKQQNVIESSTVFETSRQKLYSICGFLQKIDVTSPLSNKHFYTIAHTTHNVYKVDCKAFKLERIYRGNNREIVYSTCNVPGERLFVVVEDARNVCAKIFDVSQLLFTDSVQIQNPNLFKSGCVFYNNSVYSFGGVSGTSYTARAIKYNLLNLALTDVSPCQPCATNAPIEFNKKILICSLNLPALVSYDPETDSYSSVHRRFNLHSFRCLMKYKNQLILLHQGYVWLHQDESMLNWERTNSFEIPYDTIVNESMERKKCVVFTTDQYIYRLSVTNWHISKINLALN